MNFCWDSRPTGIWSQCTSDTLSPSTREIHQRLPLNGAQSVPDPKRYRVHPLVGHAHLPGRKQALMFSTFRRLPYIATLVNHLWLCVGLVVWLATVACGAGWLTAYSTRAGASPTATPAVIPPAAATSPRPFQLLMFAHPKCP